MHFLIFSSFLMLLFLIYKFTVISNVLRFSGKVRMHTYLPTDMSIVFVIHTHWYILHEILAKQPK